MSEAKCQGRSTKGPCSRSAGDSGYCLLHDPGEHDEPEPGSGAAAVLEALDDERHESEEYELVIRDLVWSVDHHQATVEFEALGAPNYSYSRNNPTLRVTVDMTMDLAHRLSSGVGSALAHRGGYRDAAEVDPVTVATFGLPESKAQGAPTMPELQHIERACRRALRWHLKDAREELARAKGRADAVEALVGLSFPAAKRS
jgi:hypothetical protein